MRYGYDDADLDNVIRILKLPALNRQAARAELRTLLSVGIAILARPRDIAPGLQNEALAKIADACVSLQEALRDGYDAVLQRTGYTEGGVFDADSPEAEAFALLNRLGPALESLWELATVPALPVRRGAPSDDRRMIFLEECARYFIRWTGKKLSASRGSRFANFAQAIFSTMEIEQADDLSWQIKRMLQKRVAKFPRESI